MRIRVKKRFAGSRRLQIKAGKSQHDAKIKLTASIGKPVLTIEK